MGTPTDLGKVCIVPRGNYSASAQYERLDVVTNEGSAYISILGGTGNPVSDTTHWYKLVSAGDGISSITGPVSAGNVDTYTINYGTGNIKTFTVTNGTSISGISKTSTSGLVDTYTITLNDGATSTFTVTNARSIVSISLLSGTHSSGTTDVYKILYNDDTMSTFSVYNGVDGSGNVSSVNNVLPDSYGNVAIDVYTKPSGGIPIDDLSSGVRTSLGLADSALQEHQSLAAYRTSSSQDIIDDGKLAIDQGVAHAGEFMIVGSDGKIIPTASIGKNRNIFSMSELGAIENSEESIADIFPDVTISDVQSLDEGATLSTSHAWYVIEKFLNDYRDTEATLVIDGKYYINHPIDLVSNKTITGYAEQYAREFMSAALYTDMGNDIFQVKKNGISNVILKNFSIIGSGTGNGINVYKYVQTCVFKNLSISRFANGINKNSGGFIYSRILNCKIYLINQNCIYLPHDNNDQNNGVTIDGCELLFSSDYIDSLPDAERIPNDTYGNCIFVCGSGIRITNTSVEYGICGINLGHEGKYGVYISRIYTDAGANNYYADVYLPEDRNNLELYFPYIHVDESENFFIMSKGIYIGDYKVKHYGRIITEDINSFYNSEESRFVITGNSRYVNAYFKHNSSSPLTISRYGAFKRDNYNDALIYSHKTKLLGNETMREKITDYSSIKTNNLRVYGDIGVATFDDSDKTMTIVFNDSLSLLEFFEKFDEDYKIGSGFLFKNGAKYGTYWTTKNDEGRYGNIDFNITVDVQSNTIVLKTQYGSYYSSFKSGLAYGNISANDVFIDKKTNVFKISDTEYLHTFEFDREDQDDAFILCDNNYETVGYTVFNIPSGSYEFAFDEVVS